MRGGCHCCLLSIRHSPSCEAVSTTLDLSFLEAMFVRQFRMVRRNTDVMVHFDLALYERHIQSYMDTESDSENPNDSEEEESDGDSENEQDDD